jgi:hypothetical protein
MRVLETPPAVPKLPARDHLANHGITACPNWLETKKSAQVTQNFEDGPKKFGGCEKVSGDAKKFPQNMKMFLGLT